MSASARRLLMAANVTAPPSNVTAYQTAVLADSPVRYYPLQETTTGTVIDDISTNDVDGSSNSMTLGNTPGPYLGARFASSASQRFLLDTGAALRAQRPLSLTAWIRPTSWSGAFNIFEKRAASTGWRFYVSSGQIICSFFGVGDVIESGTSVSLNTWQHIALTVAGGGSTKFYVDGSLVHTGSFSGASANSNLPNVGNNTMIGGISDVAVFNAELSSGQIAAHITAAGV